MRAFFNKIIDDDLPTLAAALAYYSALSIAPLAVITLIVLSYLPSSMDQILAQIQLLFGAPAAEMASRLFAQSTNSTTRSWAGILSVLMSLIFASAMFAQLQVSLNRIFEVKSRPLSVWLLKRLQSVGLVFGLIAFLFLSSIALEIMQRFKAGFILGPIQQHSKLLVMVLCPVLLLKLLPERKVTWKAALIGGVITTVLFEMGNKILAYYLQVSAVASTYGAMGTLLAFLLWIFYSALILLFGAEICFYVGSRRLK